jgi:hypothetical protein
MSNTQLSVCGVSCSTDCKAFSKECAGCIQLGGKVSWAKFYGKERCPIYDCVQESKYTTCGECCKAPCQVWLDTRNPDASDEAFRADLISRLANLKTAEKK